VETLRTRLAETLAHLSDALRPLLETHPLPAEAPPVAARAVDRAALSDLVERWSRLLAESDAGTTEGLAREKELLHALFGGAAAFDGFASQVNAYDFEGALEALQRAAGAVGIEG
jgi:hypothetical protein